MASLRPRARYFGISDGVAASGAQPGPSYEPGSIVPEPGLPLVSLDPAGACYHSTRDSRSLASGGLPLLPVAFPKALSDVDSRLEAESSYHK
jgi:hypothetical protein